MEWPIVPTAALDDPLSWGPLCFRGPWDVFLKRRRCKILRSGLEQEWMWGQFSEPVSGAQIHSGNSFWMTRANLTSRHQDGIRHARNVISGNGCKRKWGGWVRKSCQTVMLPWPWVKERGKSKGQGRSRKSLASLSGRANTVTHCRSLLSPRKLTGLCVLIRPSYWLGETV